MNDTSCLILKGIVDRMESISYDLYFHSRAHYVSADYYEDLDRCLVYILSVCQTVAVVSSGVIIAAIGISGEKIRVIAAIFLVLAVLASTTVTTVKDDVKYNPAEKSKLHNTAGLQLKRLSRKADLYALMGKNTGTPCYDMEFKYNHISTKHSEIEENVIRSEKWSFWCAYSTLSPMLKELAEKHKKYIPKEGSCEFTDLEICRDIESSMYFLVYYTFIKISVIAAVLQLIVVVVKPFVGSEVALFKYIQSYIDGDQKTPTEPGETVNCSVTAKVSTPQKGWERVKRRLERMQQPSYTELIIDGTFTETPRHS
ncbi:uncharacterized protein [Ptychodera flava]|uniref:uncharacterized protein n=1 Tax=Ptychodera flava TaxID=63121 RepID=UPI00396A3FBA